MFVSGNITVLSVVLRLYTECRSVILETIRHEAQRAHLHRTEYTTYLKLEVLRIANCGFALWGQWGERVRLGAYQVVVKTKDT